MKVFLKLALCSTIIGSCCFLGGCGSNGPENSSDFEKSIRAPKGPPPPEAAKATAEQLARDKSMGTTR